MSLCQSTSLPSLAHSAAQVLPPPRAEAFWACVGFRRSRPRPLRPTSCPSPGSQRRPTSAIGTEGDLARRVQQQQPDAVRVWHFCAVDPRLEYEAFGIDEQMALSAFDLLGGVETSLLDSHSGGLDRLGVHYARARLGVPAQPRPQTLA